MQTVITKTMPGHWALRVLVDLFRERVCTSCAGTVMCCTKNWTTMPALRCILCEVDKETRLCQNDVCRCAIKTEGKLCDGATHHHFQDQTHHTLGTLFCAQAFQPGP